MLSKENIINNGTYDKISSKTNKNVDIISKNNKLYDINEDCFNVDNDNNDKNGLTLNTLKKFKTFKEYKESLGNFDILKDNPSKKMEFSINRTGSSKISDISKKGINLKFDNLDQKFSSSKKDLLLDLQNTRDQFLKDKHKHYQKLHIPNFGYPNIKKLSRSSSSLLKSTPNANNAKPKGSSTDGIQSDYIESLKKEALSLAQKMKKIDENASQDIIKKFEKITNNSLKKSMSNPNNDHFNKMILKEIKNSKTIKREGSKYDIIRSDLGNITKKNANTKNDLKSIDVKTKDKDTSKTNNDNDKELKKLQVFQNDDKNKSSKLSVTKDKKDNVDNNDNVIVKKDNEKKDDNNINDINHQEFHEIDLTKNISEKNYITDYNQENMNDIVDNLSINISSPVSYSKNIIERSKQIKEKRRKEKKKVIEKLDEMKKIQEERIKSIEKESTEWKQTITEIEKQLASLKVSICSTDGLFTDLFKKGKELELEIDNIKKKNMEFEKSHYKNLDSIDSDSDDEIMNNNKNSNSEQYEYFNESSNENKETLSMDENDDLNTIVSNTTDQKK